MLYTKKKEETLRRLILKEEEKTATKEKKMAKNKTKHKTLYRCYRQRVFLIESSRRFYLKFNSYRFLFLSFFLT